MSQEKYVDFSVYLDDSQAIDKPSAAYVFQGAIEKIEALSSDEILPALARIRQQLAAGNYAAGWISYETGLFLESTLTSRGAGTYKTPFLCFGVYPARQVLSSQDSEAYWADHYSDNGHVVGDMHLNISRDAYENSVAKIHDYLASGDIYQVNYTHKALFDFYGRPESYFAALRKAQRVKYGAFIKSADMAVLSLSPELFFQKTGRKIVTRPMKGTCPRGRTLAEDRQQARAMTADEKSRAENLMIVDLLRNDLAKISAPASVKLERLYDVERYRTLFQMTSTISAEAPEDVDMVDLITALFPCGSVTGAPKIRAMELISELETAPRGIYTGAIGYMGPDGDGCFSVPIRTITLDAQPDGGCRGEMGIGSAIVADSVAAAEYDECLLKAQFAARPFRDFDLIETLRWSGATGYDRLELHMARLAESARYFDFACDGDDIRAELAAHAAFLPQDKAWKVRLLLSRTGKISLTSVALAGAADRPRTITLSDHAVRSDDPMLFHKTTARDLYDNELTRHRALYGSYDVLFVNEAGELVEGAYNNLFIEREGVLYTPCVDAGLLDGVLRQSLRDDPAANLVERRLLPADLKSADRIYMGNSVRGLVEVSLG